MVYFTRKPHAHRFVDSASGAGAPDPPSAPRARGAGGTSADVQADNIFEIAEKHDPMARFGVETAQNRPKLR